MSAAQQVLPINYTTRLQKDSIGIAIVGQMGCVLIANIVHINLCAAVVATIYSGMTR